MSTLSCSRCWLSQRMTPGEWEFDGDLYCEPCRQTMKLEVLECVRVGSKKYLEAHKDKPVPTVTRMVTSSEPEFPQQEKHPMSKDNLSQAIDKHFSVRVPGDDTPVTERTVSRIVRRGKEVPAPPTNGSAEPIPPPATVPARAVLRDAIATIHVPEGALDAWWLTLPIDDKAKAFSSWLNRAMES